ncbi:hypothetical protein BDZ94DRAFT_1151653, partial [Collybia nuda]
DAEKIVRMHIKLLHQYNEAKDATQASPMRLFPFFLYICVLNNISPTQLDVQQLALLRETTVRQLHEELGLDTSD